MEGQGLSVLSLSAANSTFHSPRNSRNVGTHQAPPSSSHSHSVRGNDKQSKAFREFVRNEFITVTARITSEFEQALKVATSQVPNLQAEVALLRQQLTQVTGGNFSVNDKSLSRRTSRASHVSRSSRTSLMVPSAVSSRRGSRNKTRGSNASRGSQGVPMKSALASPRNSDHSVFSSASSISSASSFHSSFDEKTSVPPDIQLRVPSDKQQSDSDEETPQKEESRASGRLFSGFKSSQIIARLRVGLGGVASSSVGRLKVPALLSGGVRSNSLTNNVTNPVSVAVVPTDDGEGCTSMTSLSSAATGAKDGSMASIANGISAMIGVKDTARDSVDSAASVEQADKGTAFQFRLQTSDAEADCGDGGVERPAPIISSPAPPPLELVPGMANAPDGCAPVLAFDGAAPAAEDPRPTISVQLSEPNLSGTSRANPQAWQAVEVAGISGPSSLQDPPPFTHAQTDGPRLSCASMASRGSNVGESLSFAPSNSSDVGDLPLFGPELSHRSNRDNGSFLSTCSSVVDTHIDGHHHDKKRVVFFGHQETTASVVSNMSELPGMEDGCYHVLPIWFSQQHRLDSVATPRLTFQADDESESDEEDMTVDQTIKKRCSACCSRFMIHPSSSWRMAWDVLGAFLVSYECIMIPLQFLSFEETAGLIVIAWLLRIYWTSDLPCSMCTGYHYPDGKAEMRPRKVMKNYFRTWFVFDFLMVTIDWIEVFMRGLSGLSAARMGKNLKGLRMLRMVRVWRLLRLKSMPNILKNVMEAYFRSEVASIVIAILKIMLFICWLNHVMACCWYGLAIGAEGEDNWLDAHFGGINSSLLYHYWSAFHWSLSGFTGNMEVVPHNLGERVFSVLVLLLTYVISASVVSSITSLMTRLEIATALEARKFHSLKQYLLDNHISSRVALRVTRNAQYALDEQKKNTPESSIELLGLISDPLRVELHFEINMPILGHHPFFRNYAMYAPGMMRQVCHLGIGQLSLSRGDIVFSEGEVTSFPSMFFLLDGRLNYSHRIGDIHELNSPDWFGEAILWTPWTHCGVMRAKSECRCKAVEAETFSNVCTQWYSTIKYAQKYGKAFVHHLNNHPRGVLYLTDIDDPDMDVEWTANKSLPKEARQNSGTNRLSNLMQSKSRSSVFSRDSVPLSPHGRLSFMGKAFSMNPFRRHSANVEENSKLTRSRSPPLGMKRGARSTPPPGEKKSKGPRATPPPKAEKICIASEIADPDRPTRQARIKFGA